MMTGISEIASDPSNRICSDCFSNNVQFGSAKFGMFICSKCAAVHRELKTGIIKSIELDKWSAEEIHLLRNTGNKKIADIYEPELPPFYRRPDPKGLCADIVRQQFIAAKYIRLEFQDSLAQEAYHRVGGGGFLKCGRLMKRLRDSNRYVERLFELSEKDNYLRYFVKDLSLVEKQTVRSSSSSDNVTRNNSVADVSELGSNSAISASSVASSVTSPKAKARIGLDKLNATFLQGVGPDARTIMQLLYPCKEGIRSIYLYSSEECDLVNWYNAIRGCKYYRALMSLTEPDCSQLTYDFQMVGWLEKTGPLEREAWKRRWCCFGKRTLVYFADEFEAFGKGEIWLGESNGVATWQVHEGPPQGFKKKCKGFLFTLITPERRYVFSAESPMEQSRWISTIRKVLEKPVTPQDMAESANVAQYRKSRKTNFF